MSELHLDSLEITNFRCFEHLVIEKLGRVNLIVGKNSVGKTALLEGLWLLASEAEWSIIHKILYDRNELVHYNLPASSAKQQQIEAISNFFTGRKKISSLNQEFIIQCNNSWTNLPDNFEKDKVIFFKPFIDFYLVYPKDPQSMVLSMRDYSLNIRGVSERTPVTERGWAGLPIITRDWINLPLKEKLEYDVIEQSKKTKTVFIPLRGLTWQAVCTYWDDIALTNKEEAIISCLQLLDPVATRFTFKGENMQDRVRYSVVKTGRFSDPVPLANMGEGIQRIFAIALAMTVASNGYLLIDEIETGFYHQAQPDVWRAVFKLAHEWNVQVFATTHSWDCVEAFQEAAAEDQNEGAMLIRLQQKRSGEGIEAVLYDEALLAKATRQQVEVR